MTSTPFKDTLVSAFIRKRILELRSRKNQADIAQEAGFRQPNVLSMIKSGQTKLPLDRVPGLAKALECDPRHLFGLAIKQPGFESVENVLQEIYGVVVTRNEQTWVETVRQLSEYSDPPVTARHHRGLKEMFRA